MSEDFRFDSCRPDSNSSLIGWICSYTPEELIFAAGFIPYRIGPAGAGIGSDAFLPANLCPYVRSLLEVGSTGAKVLRGVIFADSCDAMRRLGDIWSGYSSIRILYRLDCPRRCDEAAENYLIARYRELLTVLEQEAGRRVNTDDIRNAVEILGFSRDGCSFPRATLGAALGGLLPRFDLIVATSHLCDGQNKALEELAARMDSPYLLLDTPCDCTPAAVDYLTSQLERLEIKLAELACRRVKPEDWERIFGYSNETRNSIIRLAQLRRNRPCPFYGRAAFSLAIQSLLMMGTPFLRDCYAELVQEAESKRPDDLKGERFRVAWLLAYPYFQDNFVPWLEGEQGVRVVTEEFSQVFWDPLDPAQPMKSSARKMLQNPNLGPVTNRVKMIEQMALDYKVDGVLHYSHWGCRQGCGGVRPIADALNKLQVPFLDLDGDCIDSRNYSKGQTLTRLQGFLELMGRKKGAGPRTGSGDHFYLGTDIGSLSAKAVVVDKDGKIALDTVILTGASSRKAILRSRDPIPRMQLMPTSAVFRTLGCEHNSKRCSRIQYLGTLLAKGADDIQVWERLDGDRLAGL